MSSKTTKRKRATAPTPASETSSAVPPTVVDAELPTAAVDAALTESVSAVAELTTSRSDAGQELGTVPVADSPRIVGLESHHTVKDAAVLKNSLLQVIAEPDEVTIDAKSVERIDTAIMQLLCAFVRDRAERGLKVCWDNPTQAFLDAARLLGVSAMLALPNAAGAAQ